MDSPQMTAMGMKRKDMRGPSPSEPMKEKDYDNEVCYPCIHVDGKQAVMLGAESLDDGECVKITGIFRVKKTTVERDGEKYYTLDLDLLKASDPEAVEDCGDEESSDESSDSEGDGDVSPGLAYILKGRDNG